MSAQALYRKWRSQAFDEIVAQEHVTRTLRNALRDGRVAHAYLFTGPRGTGKTSMARLLAKAVNCIGETEEKPCNQCAICRSITDGSSLDLIEIDAASNRGIDEVRDLRDKVNFRPNECRYRVYILNDADYLNQEGANCLLKTLEEPPADSLIILIGTSQQRQLPTIRSRCQIIRFAALSQTQVAALLEQSQAVGDPTQIAALAARADGSLQRALELADPELAASRVPLLEHLVQADIDSVVLAKYVHETVEAAGKEAPPRRERLRQMILETAEFYRYLMRQLVGAPAGGDKELDAWVARAAAQWPGSAATAALCLERCLAALREIDANANVATLTASWIDELAELARRPR